MLENAMKPAFHQKALALHPLSHMHGEYMTEDRIRSLYLDEDYNCAESTLIYLNERLNLGLSMEDIHLVSAYGGGFGCGITCGALCASMAALGRVLVSQRAHSTQGFKQICADYVSLFRQRMGCIDCSTLKEKNTIEGQRCLKTVVENAELIESYLKENRQGD
jgi:C_GCAxxG_C_C family probable redox protein